ncbi:hypothetical protein [Spirosoma endbachense]|uniref:hypothetical protein n=1 Tax=Spirosoma endbachense TaxID=2666025 RepID=UPI001390A9DD|nr:hypothetical protein [Spirosoma endbachense]
MDKITSGSGRPKQASDEVPITANQVPKKGSKRVTSDSEMSVELMANGRDTMSIGVEPSYGLGLS